MKIEIRQLYAPVARPYVMPCGHAGPRPCRARAPQSTRDAALVVVAGRNEGVSCCDAAALDQGHIHLSVQG